jgi:hypothetical protein
MISSILGEPVPDHEPLFYKMYNKALNVWSRNSPK